MHFQVDKPNGSLLARAFLDKKRKVMIFDEPTAHLDIETELELKEKMMPLMQDRLVFFATHRLHWMHQMDYILVMDEGKLVESGTYAELLAKNGYFCKLLSEMRGIQMLNKLSFFKALQHDSWVKPFLKHYKKNTLAGDLPRHFNFYLCRGFNVYQWLSDHKISDTTGKYLISLCSDRFDESFWDLSPLIALFRTVD